MTRHVRTAVTCDAQGCMESVVADDARALQVAQIAGWTRRRPPRSNGRSVDLCPAHKGAPS